MAPSRVVSIPAPIKTLAPLVPTPFLTAPFTFTPHATFVPFVGSPVVVKRANKAGLLIRLMFIESLLEKELDDAYACELEQKTVEACECDSSLFADRAQRRLNR